MFNNNLSVLGYSTMSNRDKIVETAVELFHFFGYDGTSIDMLIKEAGVSKSNFYYYFEGKEALGLEVMETVTAFYKDLMSETLLSNDLPILLSALARFTGRYLITSATNF